jgi:Putative Flp pilus-assembly TadE/G-like
VFPLKISEESEKGSYSILFGVIFGTGLLIVVFTIVLDGGNISAERRVLQNVAESSALALAKECSISSTNCAASLTPEQLAASNSPDQLTTITEVCVKGINRLLQTCQLPSSTKLDCAQLPAGTSNYVRVRTQTKTSDGGSLSPLFGNGSNYQLNGCAQAIWGNASSAPVFAPFALSICEWARLGSGTNVINEFQTNQGVATCTYSFTDLQGQSFIRTGISGWAAINLLSPSIAATNQASELCPNPATDTPATLRIGDVVDGISRDTSSINYCGDSNLADKIQVWVDQEVYLPLVTTVKLSGQATQHTVEAFTGFRFLGYSIKGVRGGVSPTLNWCSNNDNCIYGQFTNTLSPNSDVNIQPGAPNIGLQAIKLI